MTDQVPLRAATILVVDDNADMRHYLQYVLERRGYHVIAVDDGAPAINLLTQLRFNLVLADLVMPAVGGLELTRHVRAHHGGVPVVVLSTDGDYQEREARQAGAAAVLVKPVEEGVLLATVEQVLGSKT